MNKRVVELVIAEDDNLKLGVDAIALVENPAIEETFLYFKEERFVESRAGENEGDFIGRCMSDLSGEFPKEDQRLAVCYSYWKGEAQFELEDACWPGYEAIGLKPGKGGKMVPNCVPVKSSAEKFETYNDYPESATTAAKRALEWRDKNPDQGCGTPVGWARANQLAKRENISEETIARMASFARHKQNSDTPYSEGCGGLMWDAWGGTAGIEWASNKLEEIRMSMAEEGEMEINVLGYNTRNFKLCPGAIATFKHLVSMNPDEETAGMIRSAAIQADTVFGIEQKVLDAGVATVEDLFEATLIVKDFMDLMHEIDEELGMVHNVDYMMGHLDVIGNLIPDEEFEIDTAGLPTYVDEITEDKKKKNDLISTFSKEDYSFLDDKEAVETILKLADGLGYSFANVNAVNGYTQNELGESIILTEKPIVMYKYTGGISGNSRDFCVGMVQKNQYYRKEDIDLMANIAMNPGFGEGGAATYSIWRFKGGPNCKHYWNKYFVSLQNGRVTIINGGRVSGRPGTEPFDMPNNGYVRARMSKDYHFAEDRRIVTGPAMIPDIEIPRKAEDGSKYYVYFTEDTIRQIAEKFMRQMKLNQTNIEHDTEDVREKNYVYESWIIENPEMDKSKAMGFELPKGTWMISMRVMDDTSWNLIKQGKIKGFSVEGFFGEMVKEKK
jgi:hypothetical protein